MRMALVPKHVADLIIVVNCSILSVFVGGYVESTAELRL
jgi:hypothetical protein